MATILLSISLLCVVSSVAHCGMEEVMMNISSFLGCTRMTIHNWINEVIDVLHKSTSKDWRKFWTKKQPVVVISLYRQDFSGSDEDWQKLFYEMSKAVNEWFINVYSFKLCGSSYYERIDIVVSEEEERKAKINIYAWTDKYDVHFKAKEKKSHVFVANAWDIIYEEDTLGYIVTE